MRNSLALALVGWYLMNPQWSDSKNAYDTAAPLSHWSQKHSFNTADECEDYRSNLIEGIRQNAGGAIQAGSFAEVMIRLATVSRCVASDDPRLKEK
jgi:hypothetical protein